MQPQLGDRAFEVEWCYELPLDENGDVDMDGAKSTFSILPSREKALELAKKVLPQDRFGSVRITPVEFTDPFGDGVYRTFLWEPCGDCECYEGEECPTLNVD